MASLPQTLLPLALAQVKSSMLELLLSAPKTRLLRMKHTLEPASSHRKAAHALFHTTRALANRDLSVSPAENQRGT